MNNFINTIFRKIHDLNQSINQNASFDENLIIENDFQKNENIIMKTFENVEQIIKNKFNDYIQLLKNFN